MLLGEDIKAELISIRIFLQLALSKLADLTKMRFDHRKKQSDSNSGSNIQGATKNFLFIKS